MQEPSSTFIENKVKSKDTFLFQIFYQDFVLKLGATDCPLQEGKRSFVG